MTEKEDIMKRFLALVGLMMIGVAPLAGTAMADDMKDDGMMQESMKDDGMGHGDMNHDGMKHDDMKHDAMKGDDMGSGMGDGMDTMKHDNMSDSDAMQSMSDKDAHKARNRPE